MGLHYLKDPTFNKGLAFTLQERHILGIHGLQPARFKTQEQIELCKLAIMRFPDDLNKYLYLVDLNVWKSNNFIIILHFNFYYFQYRNEKVFYKLVSEDIENMLPIIYTPTVGLACQKFGLTYRRPRGLFITIHDRGHIYDV